VAGVDKFRICYLLIYSLTHEYSGLSQIKPVYHVDFVESNFCPAVESSL
jgi:hypothetical protein